MVKKRNTPDAVAGIVFLAGSANTQKQGTMRPIWEGSISTKLSDALGVPPKNHRKQRGARVPRFMHPFSLHFMLSRMKHIPLSKRCGQLRRQLSGPLLDFHF